MKKLQVILQSSDPFINAVLEAEPHCQSSVPCKELAKKYEILREEWARKGLVIMNAHFAGGFASGGFNHSINQLWSVSRFECLCNLQNMHS